MSNLIEPLGKKKPKIDKYLLALQKAHDYIVAKYYELIQKQKLEAVSTFGQDIKRNRVNLSGDNKPAMVGAIAQSIVEIINQLANIERLIDALKWARDNGATTVIQCNPTTSSKGHDLTVSGSGGISVFEISDTMSTYGEEKVKNDLETLFDCECNYCSDAHRSFLVISEEASKYLPKDNYEISEGNFVSVEQVNKVGARNTTYIVEFCERVLSVQT